VTEGEVGGDAAVAPRSAMTDWSGYYRVCDVSAHVELTASSKGKGWEESSATLRLEPGQLHVQDFELREEQIVIIPKEVSNIAAGANVGIVTPGDGGGLIQGAPTVNAFARLLTVSGIQLGLGFHYGVHDIEGTREKYRLSTFYVEPRYAFRMVSKTLTPFIGVRAGLAMEAVWQGDGDFNGTGVELGLSAGVTYLLDRRVQLEVGGGLGTTRFSDFSHDKAGRWTSCLDGLQGSGNDLPHIVQSCSPSYLGGVATTLDQPVQHPDSGRRDRWWGLWLGFVIPLFESG